MGVAETCKSLYEKICSFENLYKAFLKTRKYKRYNQEVLGFEYNLEKELFKLKEELQGLTYEPKRPQRLIFYEPARREMIMPAFRDRIVQQALLQVIEPVFEKYFIFDSYAFRIGKGTHSALERFDEFKRKVSPRRFPNSGHILKADIKNYYPSVNHNILIRTLKEKIADEKVIKLIEIILSVCPGDKGIAVGSPCSQLFANIYLNKLDYFIKHNLRNKFYLRYADDFVVLNNKLKPLQETKQKIEVFLRQSLHLELNQDKTKIISTNKGVDLLGYKIFYFHRLIRKRNLKNFKAKLKMWQEDIKQDRLDTFGLGRKIKGWVEYARYANSYKLRKSLLSKSLCN
jgi:retron-type reverse transcriptase